MRRYLLFALPFTLAAADLPIREIVLYKHGVGYFQRAGDLKAGETARLDFKASEMNDVLKSLTLEEKGGGKVAGLRYDSSEPLATKLAEFPFKVDGQQSLAGFLDQVKGARLEMKFEAGAASGVVVSARMITASQTQPEREQVVLMLDSGDLRTFDLSAAKTIRFPDAKLQEQLKDYLAAVNQSRSKDKRSLYIDSTDNKSRAIVASYMVPSAVWKSSYRLILGDKSDPMLEGWAIVDNTTGEDWNGVRLSVVSGRPISFISPLYEPRYVVRETVELAEGEAVVPKVYDGRVERDMVMNKAAPAPPAAAPRPEAGRAPQVFERLQTFASINKRVSMQSSVAATAEGLELGELFEYRFDSPVTVKKSESAMLPFLQQKVTARKLLIYSDGAGQNPMNAAEITNSTGKTLDGGPITVYDSNAYAGEALVETVKTGDKRLISYGVDLGTRITTAFDSGNELIREFHVRRGVLTTRLSMQETRTYTARNVDPKAKTLIIEQPARPDYKLLNQKPMETTASAYRFEVKLAASATQKFPVIEEHVYENAVAVSSVTPEVMLGYVQNKALSEAGRKVLQQILELKRQIALNNGQIHAAETETNEIVRDQERIRQNINSLRQVNGQQEQVQKYSKQLADQEGQLATLRDRSRQLNQKKTELQGQLDSLIERMEF